MDRPTDRQSTGSASGAEVNTGKKHPGWGLEAPWLLLLLGLVPTASTLLWWLGTGWFGSRLQFLEFQQFGALLAVAVAGGYQLYFWVQRNSHQRRAICVRIPLDDRIPFVPAWIWPYSLLYYLVIGVVLMSIPDLAFGVHLVFGAILLLLIACGIFYFVPTYVPNSYRRFEVNNRSTRYLAFVQSMDNERNAFPSMHCALASYVGFAIVDLPLIGAWFAAGYVVLIVVSCLLVKQHVIADTIAGVILGGLVYEFNELLPGWFG